MSSSPSPSVQAAAAPIRGATVRLHALQTLEAGSGELAANCFSLMVHGGGPGRHSLPLKRLGGTRHGELWQSLAPVKRTRVGDLEYVENGDYAFISAQLPEVALEDLPLAIERCYRRLYAQASTSGYPHLLRIWNFLSDINLGAGDDERYRQFCIGRARVLREFHQPDSSLPAATAIGGPAGSGFSLVAIAARDAGIAVENPRQLSAYRYPRDYGPQSPSFSRAMWLPAAEQSQLLVSGTASILGHGSLHPGDVAAQARQIHDNLQSLLANASERLPCALDDLFPLMYTVYLRRPQDLPALSPALEKYFGDASLLILAGDICREELLVEVEAVYGLRSDD